MVRTATIRRGRSCPLGATLSAEGVNFSVFSKSATLVELLLFDDVQAAQPARVIRLDSRRHRTYHYWHVFVPGLQAGQLYGYRVSGPCDPPPAACGATRIRCSWIPTGRPWRCPRTTSRMAAQQPGVNTAVAMKSAVADPQAYDWQGDAPLQRPSRRPAFMRCTSPASRGIPAPGWRRETRHLCRPGREDSLPGGPRGDRGGIPAGLSVRRAGRAAGPGELLGLQPRVLLRPPPGVQRASGPAGPLRRVPRPGQGAPSRRNRGHPGRGLQPHRRGESHRANAVLAGHGQQRVLHPGARPVTLCQLHRHRQYAERQSSRCPALDRGQPAVLGGGDARGRVPIRPGLNPLPRRDGPAAGESAHSLGHRN